MQRSTALLVEENLTSGQTRETTTMTRLHQFVASASTCSAFRATPTYTNACIIARGVRTPGFKKGVLAALKSNLRFSKLLSFYRCKRK